MKKLDKTRLLFGPYNQPDAECGGFLVCKVRGRVKVGGLSQGPIPWPLEAQYGSYILCGDLVRAIENEAAAAVVRHWGVSNASVTAWRKQLKVDRLNPGSLELRRQLAREIFTSVPKSEAFKSFMRRRIRERIRDREVPFVSPEQLWKSHELRLLGTVADEVLAQRLGRSLESVQLKRAQLGIAALAQPRLNARAIVMLGEVSDEELAARFGRTVEAIHEWRAKLGRTCRKDGKRWWTWREMKLLRERKHSDAELARRLHRTRRAVQSKRAKIGILKKSFKKWTAKEIASFGGVGDETIARRTLRSLASVQLKRRRLKSARKK